MKRIVFQLCIFFLMSLFLSSCERITESNDTPDYELGTSESLKVTAPVYGENLKPGTTYLIKYSIPSQIKKVTIALYRKSTFQFNIASEVENTGSVSWSVPADIFNSVHYKLKICDSKYPSLYYGYGENFYVKADWE